MKRSSPGLILATVLLLAGCERRTGGSTVDVAPALLPSEQALNRIPLGAPPGQPVNIAQTIANPFEGQPQAVAEGKTLYGAMNCVYCHASAGAGLIGPSLDGPGWRYGGAPAEIYNSIHDGRPKGMPAWGGRLPPSEIWKLVAYIESLGGAAPPAATSTVDGAAAQPSTTGPQTAQQSQADSAHTGLVKADLGDRR